jgi:N-methylhydantoinase B
MAKKSSLTIDPITFEVLRNAFTSIGNEMGVVLEKSAYSVVVSEGMDFGTGLYTTEGDMIAQGEAGIVGHVGAMPFAVKSVIDWFAEEGFQPGDAIIANCPFLTATHLMDVVIVTPFFYKGELYGFLGATAHWADIGGMNPGGFSADATEIYQEGLRMVPVKLYRAGEPVRDIHSLILENVRLPDERLGDIRAQLGACRTGERRWAELLDKYGVETVGDCIRELQDYSERRLRDEIRKLPKGEYTFEDYIDTDGTSEQSFLVRVKVTIAEEDIYVDFEGSSPTAKGPVNLPPNAVYSTLFVAVKAMYPEIPANSGCFRPIHIKTPENSIVNPPFPSPVSGASELYCRVPDAFLGAMAKAVPEKVVAASYGSFNNFVMGGWDPIRNHNFVLYIWGEGGWGAMHDQDGTNAVIDLIANGKNEPVEALEAHYPIRIERYSLRPDSEGPGRFRGGLGIEREIVVVAGDFNSFVAGDRAWHPPYGICGGEPAETNEVVLNPGRSDERLLSPRTSRIPVHEGDMILYRQPGGGGYGNPLERMVSRVEEDVRMGYISVQRARDRYGVVIDEATGQADLDATRSLRDRRCKD